MPSQPRMLLRSLQSADSTSVGKMLHLLTTILSLRNVLLLFCLLNIKNLPLVWELRLIYRSWRAWTTKRGVAGLLEKGGRNKDRAPASSHPLFAPLTITTTSPLLEIDHNLHKSNSTYFSDLDESRTALMVHLLSSTKFSPAELEREGFKGNFAVILGAVHASFLKEIKPYERYQVRSRVLGWDDKWILIGSVFVRPKNNKDRQQERKALARKAKQLGKTAEELRSETAVDEENEVLLASCLSKYVVKKGRFTVPPFRSFKAAGWLPEKPDDAQSPPMAVLDSSSAPTPDSESLLGEVKLTEETLRKRAQETAAKAAEKLKVSQEKNEVKVGKDDDACRLAASRWSWDDVEAERKRGMKLAENWLSLDKGLKELWRADQQRSNQ